MACKLICRWIDYLYIYVITITDQPNQYQKQQPKTIKLFRKSERTYNKDFQFAFIYIVNINKILNERES